MLRNEELSRDMYDIEFDDLAFLELLNVSVLG